MKNKKGVKMKYLVSFYMQPSPRNPDAWWDLQEIVIDAETPKELKQKIVEYLKENGVLNKQLKFTPIYDEGGIVGVSTNVYTEMIDDMSNRWVNVYFEAWIFIRKICSAQNEIKQAFKVKE
jgi:hypothetical protein